jgi:hypothetical protein
VKKFGLLNEHTVGNLFDRFMQSEPKPTAAEQLLLLNTSEHFDPDHKYGPLIEKSLLDFKSMDEVLTFMKYSYLKLPKNRRQKLLSRIKKRALSLEPSYSQMRHLAHYQRNAEDIFPTKTGLRGLGFLSACLRDIFPLLSPVNSPPTKAASK